MRAILDQLEALQKLKGRTCQEADALKLATRHPRDMHGCASDGYSHESQRAPGYRESGGNGSEL
jgi:hypothetical protein